MTHPSKTIFACEPATGGLHERTSSEANRVVAEKIGRFREIFIPYPRHIEFHSRCDYLRQLGRATRGQAQRGLRVLAPSGSGKTTAALAFVEAVNRELPPKSTDRPVVHVSLSSATTVKRLFSSILRAFGDGFAERGTEETLRQRALTYFGHANTELLIIDEVQHLNFRSGPKSDVTDSLKALLDAGVVPIVFMGTEEAEGMFTRNLQLNGRLLPPCDYDPLRSTVEEERQLFRGYWERLDQEIVRLGLMPEPTGLHHAEVVAALHTVTSGVVGRISRLTEAALDIALRRDARRIELYDLAQATDRWALPLEFTSRNPFKGMQL